MGGGLLAQILILLQTLFVHFVHDRRQAVNQSCLWAFSLDAVVPFPFSLPGLGMNTQSQGFSF